MKQLTSVGDLSLRYTMHPDGKRIFYIDGSALCAIDVFDMSIDTLMDLGGSGITFFSVSKHAKKLEKNFPQNLHNFPFLMPSTSSSLRMNLENWFDQQAIKPRVVAEFEDRALMKAFGERGTGVFTSPQTMEKDVLEKYDVRVIGRTDEIQENFYLISPERRIRNPAVTAITEAARTNLFS